MAVGNKAAVGTQTPVILKRLPLEFAAPLRTSEVDVGGVKAAKAQVVVNAPELGQAFDCVSPKDQRVYGFGRIRGGNLVEGDARHESEVTQERGALHGEIFEDCAVCAPLVIVLDEVMGIRKCCRLGFGVRVGRFRSEEHTSELQSLRHLV